MTEDQNSKPEWWTTIPAPKAKCPGINGDEVMKMFDDMDIEPGLRQFLLVDVRRNDWEVSGPSQQHTRESQRGTS
jgi:arsenical-resistance protein 2